MDIALKCAALLLEGCRQFFAIECVAVKKICTYIMCLHCLECKSAIVNRICINNSTFPHLRFTFRCDLACVINLIYICCCSCCTFEFSKTHNIMCVLCLCGLSVWILG